MKESISTVDVYPSATPTDAEIKAWENLDREEQLNRMKELLEEAEASGFSKYSMQEIIDEAKAELESENQ